MQLSPLVIVFLLSTNSNLLGEWYIVFKFCWRNPHNLMELHKLYEGYVPISREVDCLLSPMITVDLWLQVLIDEGIYSKEIDSIFTFCQCAILSIWWNCTDTMEFIFQFRELIHNPFWNVISLHLHTKLEGWRILVKKMPQTNQILRMFFFWYHNI
jgi:hypothetical protein